MSVDLTVKVGATHNGAVPVSVRQGGSGVFLVIGKAELRMVNLDHAFAAALTWCTGQHRPYFVPKPAEVDSVS
jgi:hypothetical protein